MKTFKNKDLMKCSCDDAPTISTLHGGCKEKYSLQWKWAGVSMNHTSPPPAPSSRTIYLMGGNGGPGQHRAGECCLTEDNYQLCIITCVAGHRGHRQGWKLGTTRVTKWSWAIWWMSWRIQQVYKCTWRTQICVINPLQTNNDYLCVYHLLPSTINHSPSSSPDCAGLAAG